MNEEQRKSEKKINEMNERKEERWPYVRKIDKGKEVLLQKKERKIIKEAKEKNEKKERKKERKNLRKKDGNKDG